MSVPEISVQELKKKRDDKESFLLLDVRGQDEYDFVNLAGKLIPLPELEARYHEIADYRTTEVIIHCRSGARSAQATTFLQEKGFEQVKNLRGGILAWAKDIDPSLPSY